MSVLRVILAHMVPNADSQNANYVEGANIKSMKRRDIVIYVRQAMQTTVTEASTVQNVDQD